MTAAKHTLREKSWSIIRSGESGPPSTVGARRHGKNEPGVIQESTHADPPVAVGWLSENSVLVDWTDCYRGGTGALPAPRLETHPPRRPEAPPSGQCSKRVEVYGRDCSKDDVINIFTSIMTFLRGDYRKPLHKRKTISTSFWDGVTSVIVTLNNRLNFQLMEIELYGVNIPCLTHCEIASERKCSSVYHLHSQIKPIYNLGNGKDFRPLIIK